MATFQVVLSELEVADIIISTVRKKFSIDKKTKLELNYNNDSGATISTPDEPMQATSWLEED